MKHLKTASFIVLLMIISISIVMFITGESLINLQPIFKLLIIIVFVLLIFLYLLITGKI